MTKSKEYRRARFSADVLREATCIFRQQVDPQAQEEFRYQLEIEVDDSSLTHDSSDEFFADYRRVDGDAKYGIMGRHSQNLYAHFNNNVFGLYTRVSVTASDRSKIEAVFEVFERNLEISRVPEEARQLPPTPPPVIPKVFIGHGNNDIWRDLKDHLHEQHGYDVVAYEVGARAGHEIRDVLEEMLQASSFAILVMTGEDRTDDGQLQPRMNVVHELGLFQGRLGFNRAIILLEAGTQEFSNINGVHQIRFSEGNIRETFGDVVATLNREFPGVVDEPGDRESGAR